MATSPILATLVLLNGGSSAIKKVPGKKTRHDFRLVAGSGPNGRAAHIREYTSLELFHAEQADIAQSPVRMQVLVRLHEIDVVQGAKSAVNAFVQRLQSPKEKIAVAEELAETLQAEIVRLREVSAEPNSEKADDGKEQIADGATEAGQRTPREMRAMELRRCGEEFVRHLLREEYQIADVPVLNNLDGMVEAILNFEAERGGFGNPKEQAAAEAPPAAATDSPPSALTVTTPGAPYTAEALATMPIDELKALAASLGCRGGNRRTMAKDVLEKQAK